MADEAENLGIEVKYTVQRRNDAIGKHDDCEYFVLDPAHDPHAVTAMVAYAISVKRENPELSKQLSAWIKEIERNK